MSSQIAKIALPFMINHIENAASYLLGVSKRICRKKCEKCSIIETLKYSFFFFFLVSLSFLRSFDMSYYWNWLPYDNYKGSLGAGKNEVAV